MPYLHMTDIRLRSYDSVFCINMPFSLVRGSFVLKRLHSEETNLIWLTQADEVLY